jgi:hypothetical protein
VNNEEFVNVVKGLEAAAVDFRYRYRLNPDHQMVAKLPDDIYDALVERDAIELLLTRWNIKAVPARWYSLEES